MTKNPTKGSELIIFQLGTLQTAMEKMQLTMENNQEKTDRRIDDYQDKTDKRLYDLEKFQSNQTIIDGNKPKIDIQKILLAAFGIISSALVIIQQMSQK